MSMPTPDRDVVLIMAYLRFDPVMHTAREVAEGVHKILKREVGAVVEIWRYEYLTKGNPE
jgi:hypothetical protein